MMRRPSPRTATSPTRLVDAKKPAVSRISDPSTAHGPDLAHLVLQAAPIILYVYDLQRQRSVFQNRRFGEILGHPPPEEGTSEWKLLIHPDDETTFPAHRDKLKNIQAGETLLREFRMRDADGQWRWFLSRDALLSRDGDGKPLLIVGSAFDISEQKKAEQYNELLADEMRHRAKNLVAIVEAIGRLSRPKNEPGVNKYIDAFMGRLLTLLNTGGIVLTSASRDADLGTVVRATLTPFVGNMPPSRIRFDGPAISLPERTAGGLALAIHELATNAVKYGALSVEAGAISLTWAVVPKGASSLLSLEWKESGGPLVSSPESEGFGAMVIRQALARETGGKVMLDYRPSGLQCRFEFEVSPRA